MTSREGIGHFEICVLTGRCFRARLICRKKIFAAFEFADSRSWTEIRMET
jgi:hypothetical protein